MAEAWQRVGLIINPSAGTGVSEAFRAARTVVAKLGVQTVLTGEAQLGAEALSGWTGELQVQGAVGSSGKARTIDLTRWILAQKADAVIVIGGDGTLSDVSQAIIEKGSRLPILGVGTGSTNVGRLVTCGATRTMDLDVDQLELWQADCLIASIGERSLGFAFNDVVIGYTVVGTIEGERKDIDASSRLKGSTVPGTPRLVGNSGTRVSRHLAGTVTVVCEGESVGSVVAGFAESGFFGKAISGGVCLASLAGLPAGCLVCDFPLVQVGLTADLLLHGPPIVSRFVGLSGDATIVVESVNPGAVLCVDGNPLEVLDSSDRITFSVQSRAVVGVRSRKALRSA